MRKMIDKMELAFKHADALDVWKLMSPAERQMLAVHMENIVKMDLLYADIARAAQREGNERMRREQAIGDLDLLKEVYGDG